MVQGNKQANGAALGVNVYQYHPLETNMHKKQLCCYLSGAGVCAVTSKRLNLFMKQTPLQLTDSCMSCKYSLAMSYFFIVLYHFCAVNIFLT